MHLGFDPLPGTTSQLSALNGGEDLPVVGFCQCGSVQLLDVNLGKSSDPTSYQLTFQDGSIVIVDRFLGVQKIANLNGNILELAPTGLAHSRGKSIVFDRDGLEGASPRSQIRAVVVCPTPTMPPATWPPSPIRTAP